MITLPITYHASTLPPLIEGATWNDVEPFYEHDPIRQIERASIRTWMEQHRQYLTGRVLDFGAGTQPYRDLVSGEYVPIEKTDGQAAPWFTAVMCNQVAQYIPVFESILEGFNDVTHTGGHLLLTYPTNWPEVEADDLWRFTATGMAKLVTDAGFEVLENTMRAQISLGHFRLALGYGLLARKR